MSPSSAVVLRFIAGRARMPINANPEAPKAFRFSPNQFKLVVHSSWNQRATMYTNASFHRCLNCDEAEASEEDVGFVSKIMQHFMHPLMPLSGRCCACKMWL